jgi:type I site-specific restriction endonuclease
MVGRGTRLRPDLFGIGRHKQCFYIFDYCQNLEFFSQDSDTVAGSANESLSKKLFSSRVELISELDKHKDEDQEAKQFDLLMLRLQLALLRHEKSFTRWSNSVREIASALNEKASIPMVRAELELIIELQTDEYWQDITAAMLEDVRKRLRSLVKFIEKTKRPTIYTDFTDSMGQEQEVGLPGFDSGHDVERFRDKAQQFLKAHENEPAIHKLRFNERLTSQDLDALEKMLIGVGAGTLDELKKVRSATGLGLFVRIDGGFGPGSSQTSIRGIPNRANANGEPDSLREPYHRLSDAKRLDARRATVRVAIHGFQPQGRRGNV